MQKDVLAIVVGGGPAPGINGVISSATIEAINEGMDVVGILGGFKTLFEGKESDIVPLTIEEVSRIPTRGGLSCVPPVTIRITSRKNSAS